MQKGNINVQAENIFPIIKKFLYSDQEIFLRELISNAVDATQKIKVLASLGEFKGELGELKIEVSIDKKKKKITVSDHGIGMTAEEVDKYINQIAFSGAEEFIKKFDKVEDASQIIGHFGLGFYSSFMVANKVEIITRSYTQDDENKAVLWSCDGTPEYTIKDTKRKERGTDVVLHISKDAEAFLEEDKILGLLKKYCKFLPFEIVFGTEKITQKVEGEKDKDGHDKYETIEKIRVINNTKPAWKQKPLDLKQEDYLAFYRELYPYTFEEPLFQIHLNVDYPFNLTGILYFPKIKNNFEVQKNKIQLYCNQVYVTDSVEGIVPDFLMLLHGVLDSPDIPLNVSRSYLQNDAQVKKISAHITKKVSDKLEEIFKDNREDFEKKWDDIKIFIQYGMLSDEKFYEKAEKFCLFKNTEGKYFTFEEYKTHIEKTQTDKNKKVVHLYASNATDQHTFIAAARERGYDVLLFDGVLDAHFINNLEMKLKDVRFVRVDADILDKLIEKEENLPSKLDDAQKEKIRPAIEKFADKEKYHVVFENMSETEHPMLIVQPEFMRRMKDMSAIGGGAYSFMGNMPESFNLVVNANHPLIYDIAQKESISEENEKLLEQMFDLALLSQNMLKGEKLASFIKRSIDIIGK
ncbi:MAG: Chaperone protein HtpG [Bacteroidetes bacterium ADurb.Bin408]|nr:MAG: Chaperone protein HtpG [Bacteroidetes bacterium ADurb.Bin408]